MTDINNGVGEDFDRNVIMTRSVQCVEYVMMSYFRDYTVYDQCVCSSYFRLLAVFI